ncbi:hypothetical protein [Marilutibacter chinensis]|uniref:Secreted protein with PEP-CTERM sorting signal n=1 Tax=Marilutibacter chinensis TaxID=2912247 RepID=A0ABS9HS77_9GAMM|nr:hypothetical protein [Lysobacter chinensis]MCF7221528.1 hypothetical protein [Lysobacter chinensis]
MSPPSSSRRVAGVLCILLGFALVVLLGLGVLGPGAGDAPPESLTAAFVGLVPFLLIALGAFVVGLVLLRGRTSGGNRK